MVHLFLVAYAYFSFRLWWSKAWYLFNMNIHAHVIREYSTIRVAGKELFDSHKMSIRFTPTFKYTLTLPAYLVIYKFRNSTCTGGLWQPFSCFIEHCPSKHYTFVQNNQSCINKKNICMFCPLNITCKSEHLLDFTKTHALVHVDVLKLPFKNPNSTEKIASASFSFQASLLELTTN